MLFHHLRIARPVTDLRQSSDMYCRGLGLQEIGEFTNHEGFSGCMLGRYDLPWHLEFTLCHDHPVMPAPSAEDLLVLYIPEREAWTAACNQMEQAGFTRTCAFNPYWENKGITFQDKDGYRVVLQNSRWAAS
ncbi:VOC family protein [Pantoea sp. FN0302]|uniref:VOC family protein n=1 Tax=Pantoea sp. FN0302 TaxID=3418558 RepID=UPI003CF6EAF3